VTEIQGLVKWDKMEIECCIFGDVTRSLGPQRSTWRAGARQAPQSRRKAAKSDRVSGDASSVLVPVLPSLESPIQGSHASYWRWDGSRVRRGGLVSLEESRSRRTQVGGERKVKAKADKSSSLGANLTR